MNHERLDPSLFVVREKLLPVPGSHRFLIEMGGEGDVIGNLLVETVERDSPKDFLTHKLLAEKLDILGRCVGGYCYWGRVDFSGRVEGKGLTFNDGSPSTTVPAATAEQYLEAFQNGIQLV